MGIIQMCKVQLDSSTFCHMQQMQVFIQPKDLSLSSIKVVKKLKNSLCTLCPLMRFNTCRLTLALIACLGVKFSSFITQSVFNKVDIYGNVNDSASGDLEAKLEQI